MKASDNRLVVVLCGPTASGKTAASLALADHLRIAVISADTRQVYRGMDIGTAKASREEQATCPHHLIDILDPWAASYSAAAFRDDARAVIDAMPLDVLPVIVGGAGLYLTAFLDGLATDGAATSDAARMAVRRLFDLHGRDAAYEQLQAVDPRAAAFYADRNPRRVQRALEFHATTGRPFSSTWDSPRDAAPYTVLRFGMALDTAALNERIERRSMRMWQDGLLRETEALLGRGCTPDHQAMHTVGYAEAMDVLAGRMTQARAEQALVIHTRQYAKRQRTWFRRDARLQWLAMSPNDAATRIAAAVRTINGDTFDR